MHLKLLPTVLLSLAAAAFVYAVDEEPPAESAAPSVESPAFEERKDKPSPMNTPRRGADIFVPTEEVGADAEVDFPSDL